MRLSRFSFIERYSSYKNLDKNFDKKFVIAYFSRRAVELTRFWFPSFSRLFLRLRLLLRVRFVIAPTYRPSKLKIVFKPVPVKRKRSFFSLVGIRFKNALNSLKEAIFFAYALYYYFK